MSGAARAADIYEKAIKMLMEVVLKDQHEELELNLMLFTLFQVIQLIFKISEHFFRNSRRKFFVKIVCQNSR